MGKMNPKIYVVIGVVLIAISIPLSAGMITHWPASTETWENTEILGAYGPKYLAPGSELSSITVLVRNGYIKSGEVLIDVYVRGEANDCKAWQFTPYLRAGVPTNVTLSFYREWPMMGDAPMVFTVEPGYHGSGMATITVYPGGANGGGAVVDLSGKVYVNGVEVSSDHTIYVDTLELTIAVEITQAADCVSNVYALIKDEKLTFTQTGAEWVTEYTLPQDGIYTLEVQVLDTAGGDTQLASFTIAPEPQIIEYLQTLAPRLTVETLTMGAVACMMGLGFVGYGFSMRDQW